MAFIFTRAFHIHGAIMTFAETLIYSGFGHLNLKKIFIAAVFIASSGAVMDFAMDIAVSMHEVVSRNPGIGRKSLILSGLNIDRTVDGTMTSTLLLGYSGGYITLLMAFMAQGAPLVGTFNFIYIAAEVFNTIVGSFGLVTVAPLTAVADGFLLAYK
ncbi:MAG: YibE/F family protein [Desulfobacteraceae bacterium]|nr:YibE/F family protein [Desulfobacteraceae bacterium]